MAKTRGGRCTPRKPRDNRVGVLIGWAHTEADLPEARQATHDQLISLMGAGRTGGVTWRQATGTDALSMLAAAAVDTPIDSELFDHYRRLRAMLREYGGWLVLASAPGRLASEVP